MKRFIAVLVSLMLFAAIPAASSVKVSAASSGFARSATTVSYFYKEKNNSSLLFAVPYGYCIEILRDDGDWYFARYANDSGIYREKLGYCRKEQFSPVEGVPTVTYLYKTVSVKFTPDNVSDVLPALGEISLEAAYYGALTVGTTNYAYVYCQGNFGYIEGKFEEDVADVFKPTDGNNETPKTEGGWSAGLISVIIILALFVAVILVLHFVTAKGKRKDA